MLPVKLHLREKLSSHGVEARPAVTGAGATGADRAWFGSAGVIEWLEVGSRSLPSSDGAFVVGSQILALTPGAIDSPKFAATPDDSDSPVAHARNDQGQPEEDGGTGDGPEDEQCRFTGQARLCPKTTGLIMWRGGFSRSDRRQRRRAATSRTPMMIMWFLLRWRTRRVDRSQ